VAIGAILGGVAIFLAYECHSLLIGEGISEEALEGLRAIVTAHPAVAEIKQLLSLHFGPADVLITMNLRFTTELTASGVAEVIAALEKNIRARYPEANHIFIETESLHSSADSSVPEREPDRTLVPKR
jgi:divalent metal cation (Fe/Co/Zn/Cd) transporter